MGLIGVLGSGNGGGGNERTASPTPQQHQQPQILIRETSFTAAADGEVEINVAGSVKDFPPADRIYAIARPVVLPDPPMWWVSDEVSPNLGGDWTAQIRAAVEPGQELRVSAVRVESLDLEPNPEPGGPTGPGDPTPAPEQDVREQLATLGPEAPAVSQESPPLPALAPPAP